MTEDKINTWKCEIHNKLDGNYCYRENSGKRDMKVGSGSGQWAVSKRHERGKGGAMCVSKGRGFHVD